MWQITTPPLSPSNSTPNFHFVNLGCWGKIFPTVLISSDNEPNSPSFNSFVYSLYLIQFICFRTRVCLLHSIHLSTPIFCRFIQAGRGRLGPRRQRGQVSAHPRGAVAAQQLPAGCGSGCGASASQVVMAITILFFNLAKWNLWFNFVSKVCYT